MPVVFTPPAPHVCAPPVVELGDDPPAPTSPEGTVWQCPRCGRPAIVVFDFDCGLNWRPMPLRLRWRYRKVLKSDRTKKGKR